MLTDVLTCQHFQALSNEADALNRCHTRGSLLGKQHWNAATHVLETLKKQRFISVQPQSSFDEIFESRIFSFRSYPNLTMKKKYTVIWEDCYLEDQALWFESIVPLAHFDGDFWFCHPNFLLSLIVCCTRHTEPSPPAVNWTLIESWCGLAL